MRENVKTLNQTRGWLQQQLEQCPLVEQVYPSSANYLLVRFAQTTVFRALWDQGDHFT